MNGQRGMSETYDRQAPPWTKTTSVLPGGADWVDSARGAGPGGGV